MLDKVNSGLQFGADIAGLVAAERLGIPTCGLAPKGYRTERGNRPDLGLRFAINEDSSASYTPRTIANVKNSDFTLILSPLAHSAGTVQTINACNNNGKEYYLFNPFETNTHEIAHLILSKRPSVLNIAGNRESKCPGLMLFAANFLQATFSQIIKES